MKIKIIILIVIVLAIIVTAYFLLFKKPTGSTVVQPTDTATSTTILSNPAGGGSSTVVVTAPVAPVIEIGKPVYANKNGVKVMSSASILKKTVDKNEWIGNVTKIEGAVVWVSFTDLSKGWALKTDVKP